MSNGLDYHKLATPAADGDLLIEPPAAVWPELLHRNIELQERQFFSLAGHDLRDAREAVRTAMISRDRRRAIIACGHQPGFVHPGVWAKHGAVRDIGSQLGLKAIDLIVDNDAPTQPDLIVPTLTDGALSTRAIAFSVAPAGSAYEGRPVIERTDVVRIRAELEAALGERFGQSMMPDYLAGYEEDGGAIDFVDQHVTGRVCIDASLSAYLDEYRVSRFFGGAFLADLLLNAAGFAEAYNNALHAYRRRENVRGEDRPLPDLGHDADRIETALWIYRPMERRRRLWVQLAGDRVRFFADAQFAGELSAKELAYDPNIAVGSLHPWVVRPRALTLTLWARLLACDLFVHGIGGAKYDRITDDVFRWYYQCQPPAIACVSATLRLPLPHHPVAPDDLRRLQHEIRDARFNPQRHLESPPAAALQQRDALIQEALRLRREEADRTQRRRVFQAMRQANEDLLATDPGLITRKQALLQQTMAQLTSNAVADSREFFYALQPRQRLQQLADRVVEACSIV